MSTDKKVEAVDVVEVPDAPALVPRNIRKTFQAIRKRQLRKAEAKIRRTRGLRRKLGVR